MNSTQRNQQNQTRDEPGIDEALEDMARKIDPPSREVSDDELKDPGRMTPKAPADNRS